MPAAAGERFPRITLVPGSVIATPPPVAGFIATVRRLQAGGDLAAGRGTEPLAEFGGRSAKDWLIDHVAGGFLCERDHGGMCPDEPPLAHLKNFIARFREDSGPWKRLMAARSVEDLPLGAYGLRIEAFEGVTGTASTEGDEVCVPALAATDRPVRDAVAAFLGDDDNVLLAGLDRFRVVRGHYRVRAGPSLSAPVVNRVANELVFVPAPAHRFMTGDEGGAHAWAFVVPASGEVGFAAFEEGDLLAASAISVARVCMAVEDGVVKVARHIGGGD